MNELIELANRLRREADARDADPDDFDADLTADMRQAAAALEAASSPAPGEPVAWQVYVRMSVNGGSVKQRINLYTERLPFHPGEGVEQLGEPIPLYASPLTSPPEPPQGVLEALKDASPEDQSAPGWPKAEVVDYLLERCRDYRAHYTGITDRDLVCFIIQCEILRQRDAQQAAIANAERSPLPLGGWKDISTAPDKEYSSLLSWSKEQGQRIVFVGYHHGEKRFYDSDAMEDGCNLLRIKPTHWQPLPASPSPSSGDA